MNNYAMYESAYSAQAIELRRKAEQNKKAKQSFAKARKRRK